MSKKVFVAGANGMVGSALVRELSADQECELLTPSRKELDLVDQAAVAHFFSTNQVDEVYLAAALVGGIHANNQYPADFIYQNLMMECNVIHGAHQAGVKRLLLLGSSCIYPKLAPQPMTESALLTGTLESTNEPYAIAKIAGIKLCESYNRQHGTDFRSVMPTNLYGPNDNFHPENSHVIPAMMRRIHEAKINQEPTVTIWGTGKPKREFLHVDDMASACVHVMGLTSERYASSVDARCSHINVGTGRDCSIQELAELLSEVIAYPGNLSFDTDKPDGAPRKLLDVARLSELGWQSSIELKAGLASTYQWFLTHQASLRGEA